MITSQNGTIFGDFGTILAILGQFPGFWDVSDVSRDIGGTFRDIWFGMCDGYRGTLGTYPWDVRIMVGVLQFWTIEFWNIVWNGAVVVVCEGLISGNPPVDRDDIVMGTSTTHLNLVIWFILLVGLDIGLPMYVL